MKKKKALLFLGACILSVSMLYGCGGSSAASDEAQETTDTVDGDDITDTTDDQAADEGTEESENYTEDDFSDADQPAASSEYIFPNSSTERLSRSDLEGLSAWDCRVARNEIYARHGRRFSSEDLQSYFDSCSWYNGTINPDDFDEGTLSDVERSNAETIAAYEDEMGYTSSGSSSNSASTSSNIAIKDGVYVIVYNYNNYSKDDIRNNVNPNFTENTAYSAQMTDSQIIVEGRAFYSTDGDDWDSYQALDYGTYVFPIAVDTVYSQSDDFVEYLDRYQAADLFANGYVACDIEVAYGVVVSVNFHA